MTVAGCTVYQPLESAHNTAYVRMYVRTYVRMYVRTYIYSHHGQTITGTTHNTTLICTCIYVRAYSIQKSSPTPISLAPPPHLSLPHGGGRSCNGQHRDRVARYGVAQCPLLAELGHFTASNQLLQVVLQGTVIIFIRWSCDLQSFNIHTVHTYTMYTYKY